MSISKFHKDIEALVCRTMLTENWRSLPSQDLDGALGVAMVKAVLLGSDNDINSLSNFLSVAPLELQSAYDRLSRNGFLHRKGVVLNDKKLKNNDKTSWCFVAGMASGYTGK